MLDVRLRNGRMLTARTDFCDMHGAACIGHRPRSAGARGLTATSQGIIQVSTRRLSPRPTDVTLLASGI